MSGPHNPYQAGRLGVIDKGFYADILLVEVRTQLTQLTSDSEVNMGAVQK